MAKTAVATKKTPGTSVVSMQEHIKNELAELAGRVGAPGGDGILLGQDKKFKLSDGTKVDEFPGVIVDFITGRFYYDRPFDRENPSPPACYALSPTPNGMAPPKDVPDRQCDTCAACPLNQYESADKGKGKACKEMRILALIPPDADAKTTVSVMKVPPTGLKPFDAYVTSIARSLNKAPFQVITTFSMANEEYSSPRFGDPKPAKDDLTHIAFSLKKAARERLMTPPDTSQYEKPVKKTAKKR